MQSMHDDLAAAESEESAKASVPEKAQLYAGLYLFAFLACLAAIWLPPWARWIAGTLVSVCLLTAFSMAGVFVTLARASRFYRHRNVVLRHHRLMNALAMLLLLYALGAIWSGWPAPAFAVLVAAIINFVHFGGYKNSAIRT